MESVTENPAWWKRARRILLKMALEPRTDCILCTGCDGGARNSAGVSMRIRTLQGPYREVWVKQGGTTK